MLSSFILAMSGLVTTGVILHSFKWSFTITNQVLMGYAVIFAIFALVIAVLQGFTGEAILESVAGWTGYMVGLLILRWAKLGKLGKLTDTK